jgi:myo-inositol-1(or 4)-monophosphatase
VSDPAETDLAAFETAAYEMACVAGARALAAFRSPLEVEFKGGPQDQPVTVVDRDLETYLREEIHRRFPDHGVAGEEYDDEVVPGARFVWALDPIDGTANFASHLPLWGVSIGLLLDGRPVVGCIWVPVGPSLAPGAFHARLGGGAFFDHSPVTVSTVPDERGRFMGLPGGYLRALRFRRAPKSLSGHQRSLPDARSLGSCTAELVLVACGVLRATLFLSPAIWDIAAGAVIVSEAGGHVLTWQNHAWQPLTQCEPAPPPKGTAPPSLRYWSAPFLAGAPDALERIVPRIAWHPRLPRALRRLVGLAAN